MDRPHDTSKTRSRRNQSESPSDVSAETSPRTALQQRIEAQRAQLLQAHGVLQCLYKVLLHAEYDDAVFYADTAHVVAEIISRAAEEMDSVRIR